MSSSLDWDTMPIRTVGPTVMAPPSGANSPAIMRSSVVFPAPLPPMIPTRAPRGMRKDTLSSSVRVIGTADEEEGPVADAAAPPVVVVVEEEEESGGRVAEVMRFVSPRTSTTRSPRRGAGGMRVWRV